MLRFRPAGCFYFAGRNFLGNRVSGSEQLQYLGFPRKFRIFACFLNGIVIKYKMINMLLMEERVDDPFFFRVTQKFRQKQSLTEQQPGNGGM